MDVSFEQKKIDPQILKTLAVKSDLRGAVQTGSHIGAIILNSYWLSFFWGSLWAVPIFMVQGILISCLYAGVHELSHNTVFKTRWLNEFFGRLFGFVVLVGRDQDKFEHFQHHRFTNDLERDAEIAGAKPFTLTSYLLYFFGITYWFQRVCELIRFAIGQTHLWPHLSPTQFKIVHKEARLMLLAYGVILLISIGLGSWAALKFWLLPRMTMKWFQMLQNMIEHTGMPHEPEIYANTRTVRANPIMQWLLWNMPYHTAHHTYPMIPFHRLPDLHEELVRTMGQEPKTLGHFAFQKHMIRKLIKDGTSTYAGRDITEY